MAVAAEPISPELVLVCPDLREQALAALPEAEWQSFVAQVRLRAPAVPEEQYVPSVVRETTFDLVHLLGFSAAAMLSSVAVTLALTLIANATR